MKTNNNVLGTHNSTYLATRLVNEAIMRNEEIREQMETNNKVLIIGTRNSTYLATRLANEALMEHNIETEELEIERKQFADGEIYDRVKTNIKNRKVVVVGSTRTDDEFMELYDLCWWICKNGASELTVWIPYFGYSTMERTVKSGEIVKAKTRASILSSLPGGPRITFVLTDLHASGIEYYFEGSCHTHHHYAKYPIMLHCMSIGGNDGFVLASTDAGRAKWVESLANEMKMDSAFITKRRISGSETEVAGVNADVTGRVVVIYDDMIRTGSSIIKAAEAYLKCGAKEIHVVTTHGVFPGETMFKLTGSGLFKSIACTNTLPQKSDPFSSSSKTYTMNNTRVIEINIVDSNLLTTLGII